MTILRPYQQQCLTALRGSRRDDPTATRLAVEMATGLGKTITFAAELDEWLSDSFESSGMRALVLVHTDELVRQAVDKIRIVTRGQWTIGVVKAESNEVDADIVVASVQTLARPGRKEQIRDVGKIIVDECHHAVAPTYVDILCHFGALPRTSSDARFYGGPAVPVTGYTATLARTDGQGLGAVWQNLAFSRSLPWGMRHGYLIDLVAYTIRIPDLNTPEGAIALDAALIESIAPEAVVTAWFEKAAPLWVTGYDDPGPSTVLFAPLVRSAQMFAEAFDEAGVKAEIVHGAMPRAERRAVLDRYEAGVTTVVCNAMVLTEGWDSPRTSCIIVARPTKSVPLFVQMVGRGLRPWLAASAPERADQRCTLLCVYGTTTDLATIADLSERIGDARDGVSLLTMEDEWDLGKDIEPDEDTSYHGPVHVQQWDALVQASSKAWKYTVDGAPYLPTSKRAGYVFITQVADQWRVYERALIDAGMRVRIRRLAQAPDLELAMGLAEDEAQELGGDIGALLADKGRAWRKSMPSDAAREQAVRMGLTKELDAIMASKAGGKAGRLSDVIDRVVASRVLDSTVKKIKERG